VIIDSHAIADFAIVFDDHMVPYDTISTKNYTVAHHCAIADIAPLAYAC
jgi:hypothetical protein